MHLKYFILINSGVKQCISIGALVFSFLFMLSLPDTGSAAKRQHDSHTHGIGHLNLVLDGNELVLELRSPSANVVGFEHAPKNEEQTQAVEKAIALMKEGDKLFALPKQAECSLHDAHVNTDMLEGHQDKHDSHSHDHQDKHDSHDHGHYEKHSHSEHHEDSVHSEFEAEYHFKCNQPHKLNTVDVLIFELFPGFEELEVQMLSPKGQSVGELTPKKRQLTL